MPLYLIQGSYTSAAVAALVRKPRNRLKAIRAAVESLGGTVEGGWMALGDYDYVLICKFRDNVAVTSLAAAVVAGGAVANHKTTLLLTFEEGMKAMRRAGSSTYRAPK
jgi:uncharacterized protein with GYD domain